eukprot:9684311-Alexandrium_andersonii.AAC.1
MRTESTTLWELSPPTDCHSSIAIWARPSGWLGNRSGDCSVICAARLRSSTGRSAGQAARLGEAGRPAAAAT